MPLVPSRAPLPGGERSGRSAAGRVSRRVTSTGVVYDDHHINRASLFYTAGSSAGVFTSSPSVLKSCRRARARLSALM